MTRANGIWINDRDFVQFGEPDQSLTAQIATRGRSIDFYALGMYLPNPDPILRELGQSQKVYGQLRNDSTVGGAVRRRKASVKALEKGVKQGQASVQVFEAVKAIFARLPLSSIITEMLNSPLFGYQPLEVMWGYRDGLQAPVDIIGKPGNWFVYDDDNAPRLLTRENSTQGELLLDKKFLIPRQDATYENPYGFADLSMCFWPTTFKKGGLKFWVKFTEKYGQPWVIGKQPRNAGEGEADKLLDSLYDMVQDAVAVIPDDSTVDIKEANNGANNADAFERLLMFCRSEVSIALLGQNQTTEATSNKASAAVGHQVTRDIRDGDKEIVEAEFNRLIDWIVDLNWGANAARPVFEMWEQEEVDEVQASRDEKLKRAGANFTPQYFTRAYNLQPGDLAEAPAGGAAPLSFAEPTPDASIGIAALAERLADGAQPVVDGWIERIRQVLDRASNLPQAQEMLLLEFGELDEAELVDVMAAGYACAKLKGRAEVADGK